MITSEPLDRQLALDQFAEEYIGARHVPSATYRLQFHAGFTFADAEAIAPYLRLLGINDVYASPLFTAGLGSTHGYDVYNYAELNPALGGEAGFEQFSAALRSRGMGLILDMVPNHMGIGSGNPWWMDVLENGPASVYAGFFDIDWNPVKAELAGKVLLPILGDQYGIVLERGELQLHLNEGTLCLQYNETQLPIAPDTLGQVLEAALAVIGETLPTEQADRQELESIITALRYLPLRNEADPARLIERNREKELLKRRVAALYMVNNDVRAALEAAVQRFNGALGEPRSFDALDALIEAQPYRLAFWRVAAEEINYRRFFDINELAAVRVEQPEVFAATHDLVFRLVAAGAVSGLRIDHPDGLWDPSAYFRQLQERYLLDRIIAREDFGDPAARAAAFHAWSAEHATRTASGAGKWPFYVVVEKILSEREPLPPDWAVDGTTGYDFLNQVNGIFIDPSSAADLDTIYRRFVAPDDPAGVPSFDALVLAAKHEIMDSSLASEITSLGHQVEQINEKNRRVRDFTLRGVTQALIAVIAELTIYRTYITDPALVSERDVRYVVEAVQRARRHHPRIPRSLFTFIRDILLLRNLDEFRPEDREDVVHVVMRVQQMTGPVMAKSVEDTVFYRFHRLVSLNEVGGHPDQYGLALADFHRHNAERQRLWPHTMLASSTHDTKRSEDVRARLNLLSELPAMWESSVTQWSEWNAPHKQQVDGSTWPDRPIEYLLYQSIVGAWPLELSEVGATDATGALAEFRARIVAYMQKASKEAKVHTSWLNPDDEYDAALQKFIESVLDERAATPFLEDIAAFVRRIADFGLVNSLAQTLLKLTAPGVPDTYQGAELWDFSLVDPDNRRPVDYSLRQRLLAELDERRASPAAQAALATELLATMRDGRIKLALISQALRYRRDHPQLFADGDYLPLEVSGAKQEHVCAYARLQGRAVIITVVTRLAARLMGGSAQLPIGPEIWGDTNITLPPALAGRSYRNLLTGATRQDGTQKATELALAEVFAQLPIALLVAIDDADEGEVPMSALGA